MKITYHGYTISQPAENRIVVTKGRLRRAEFQTDYWWEPGEMRNLIDEYEECIFANEKEWEYEGYTLVQTDYNWHFAIYDKDGNFAMHASCTQPLTDEEAIQNIKDLIKFREGKI